jgi:hypothetical protein
VKKIVANGGREWRFSMSDNVHFSQWINFHPYLKFWRRLSIKSDYLESFHACIWEREASAELQSCDAGHTKYICIIWNTRLLIYQFKIDRKPALLFPNNCLPVTIINTLFATLDQIQRKNSWYMARQKMKFAYMVKKVLPT